MRLTPADVVVSPPVPSYEVPGGCTHALGVRLLVRR